MDPNNGNLKFNPTTGEPQFQNRLSLILSSGLPGTDSVEPTPSLFLRENGFS